jgi:hypothetical protein
MPSKYELDVFGDNDEHLATLTIYGTSRAQIERKLAEALNVLDMLDDAISDGNAFAEIAECEESEMPQIEDWEGDGDDEDEEEEAEVESES